MQTETPTEATSVRALNLDAVPTGDHGWTEGRNFRLDSSTAAHRAAAARFCQGFSPEALEQMSANGVDLGALVARYDKLLTKHANLVHLVRSTAS